MRAGGLPDTDANILYYFDTELAIALLNAVFSAHLYWS
ncbi:hypothetical protein J2W83_000173 [Pseudomonas hunanensis]|uniref:Uncharacterized protein n=1 Tax=Pseudomonas hunanensis TaxID=1247546 RepID=A0ACC6JWN7_9PSED|nr:hypothetical protein [Pseudomonas sp. BP8]MDR6710584.1 hypothetical protein [Pseudomonas hunanensis]